MNRPVVFIHTNDQQMVGALLAAYSFRKNSWHADRFDVRLLRLEDTPHLHCREGQSYLSMGRRIPWQNRDLQSFTPLRRLVPQLMGFQGRALVTDPDVFSAGGDVFDLLSGDLGGKAVLCRKLPASKGGGAGEWATSVMALDCARLTHWRWDEHIAAMFAGRLDYKPWIQLLDEDPALIGELPEVWNSFDKLEPDTKLLHMTKRRTQPWKTGLPVDFDLNQRGGLKRWLRERGLLAVRRYQCHPDPRQEAFFFALLKEALDSGALDPHVLHRSVQDRHVRPDVYETLAAVGDQARV